MLHTPISAMNYLKKCIGLYCCLKRIDDDSSLTIGFGEKVFHGDKSLISNFNAEWEFRSFYSAWRIMTSDKILCCSMQRDSSEFLQNLLSSVEFGKIIKIENLSEYDISIHLSNNLRIDFIASDPDPDEEVVSIYCPDKIFIGYTLKDGWQISLSDIGKP